MSTTTMLQLVQQVTNELGIATPATVAGNTSQDVVQILALMNASGYELMRRADWRELTKQHTFYTEAISTTGTWTDSAYTITGIPSTAGLSTAYQVQGVGIPNATYITSVDSASQVTLNYEPTEGHTASRATTTARSTAPIGTRASVGKCLAPSHHSNGNGCSRAISQPARVSAGVCSVRTSRFGRE